jgi:UPF0716 family protein affecting phage T7 exclusion
MWFYVLLIIVVGLFGWWLSRTNLFRHWRRHGSDLDGGDHPASTSGVMESPYDGT